MTKPRFTADPPISLEGMSEQEKLEAVIDWAQRQVYRIDDWWPEDFESRIAQLEALFPGAPGTWPIVDYSSVSFNPQAGVPQILEGFIYENGQAFYTTNNYDSFDWDNPNSAVSLLQTGGWATDGNGNIVGASNDGNIVYSDDGFNFTDVALPGHDTGLQVGGVAYTGNTWYAVGTGTLGEGRPFKCWSSTNMTSWTEIYEETDSLRAPFVPPSTRGLCVDDTGALCACVEKSGDRRHRFRRSTDGGLTWSFIQINDTSGWSLDIIRNVNGNLFIGGNRMSYNWSDDNGATWKGEAQLRPADSFRFSGQIVYGAGIYLWGEGTFTTPNVWYSTDLTTWNSYSFFNVGKDSLHYDAVEGFLYTLGNTVQQSDTGLDGSWVSLSPDGFSLSTIGLYIYDAPLT